MKGMSMLAMHRGADADSVQCQIKTYHVGVTNVDQELPPYLLAFQVLYQPGIDLIVPRKLLFELHTPKVFVSLQMF
jgi:hypothetical protein